MDNLTHSLIGAAIGQTGLKKLSGLGMATLIIAANIPDIDVACFLWLEGHEHLAFRRGITHGPLAMLILPALLTALMIAFDRWQARRGTRPAARLPVRPKQLFFLAFIGAISHSAFDWLNNYGIRLLEPFSSRWFYGDTLFIIDVWLLALLIGGYIWSRRAEKSGGHWMWRGQVVATIAALYVFANGVITGIAERQGYSQLARQMDIRPADNHPLLVIANPVPFQFWKREMLWHDAPFYGAGDYALGRSVKWQTSYRNAFPDVDIQAINVEKGDVRHFLFWSRVPVVQEEKNGRIYLRDLRFLSPLTRSRFTVEYPVSSSTYRQPVSGVPGTP